MSSVRIIHLITQCEDAFGDVRRAYLARTRLQRLILECARMVARRHGVEEPYYPAASPAPPGASNLDEEISHVCRELLGRTAAICQPSEPLDSRWRAQWKIVQENLRQ